MVDAVSQFRLTTVVWTRRQQCVGPQDAGFGEDAPPRLRGENLPPRRLIDLYELPSGYCDGFRRMIAHRELCRRLDWMLAGGGRESVPPEAQCWRLLAAESGGYLGIGGKLWDSSWNLAAFLAEDAASARRRGGAGNS